MKIKNYFNYSNIFFALMLCAFILSCKQQNSDTKVASVKEEKKESKSKKEVIKTREDAAKDLLKVYTREIFNENVSREVAKVIGKEAMEEARKDFRERMNANDVHELRLTLLMNHFSKDELVLLKRIYKDPAGVSLLRNLRSHEKSWHDFLEPMILKILSNMRKVEK